MIDHRLIHSDLVPMEWILMPLTGIGYHITNNSSLDAPILLIA